MQETKQPCAICGQLDWIFHLSLDHPPGPIIETDYGFNNYQRSLFECGYCGHYENRYGGDIDLTSLYDGGYWDSAYADKVKATFSRVMDLPHHQSDNRGRVAYIDTFWHSHMTLEKKALDIGSGLAVFPAVMKEKGWDITALDPDAKASEHAMKTAGVPAITADYLCDPVQGEFSLITLNKVLEHVPDMVGMLEKVKDNLQEDGLVYLELPDGEAAIHHPKGALREEFLVEHYCAFSFSSYSLLAKKAGFEVVALERLVEPSGKFTLRGFLRKNNRG